MSRTVSFVILAGFIISSTGCGVFESGRYAMRKTTRMFTPDTRDYDHGADEDNGEWNFVGDEGRADQEKERDPDRWFKKYLMSEKANSIERNVGIY